MKSEGTEKNFNKKLLLLVCGFDVQEAEFVNLLTIWLDMRNLLIVS